MRRLPRLAALAAASLALHACGGGGDGGDGGTPSEPRGVLTGFTGDPDWEAAGGGAGGVGAGANGQGGVGVGGGARFLGATVRVYLDDGSLVGSAKTDITDGMVTVRPGASYRGTLRIELEGGPGATYYDEGRDAFVPFPAGTVLHAWVPVIARNVGVTPFTEAAYQLLTAGSTPERVDGRPTAAQVAAANERVRGILNALLPAPLQVDDLTRFPVPRAQKDPAGKVGLDARGRYAMVDSAFVKQAALFDGTRPAPALDATRQLAEDLKDGRLDGRNGSAPAAPVGERTYEPNTFGGELVAALAQRAERWGKAEVQAALPRVVSFGNIRYSGYLFDGSVTREGGAYSTVAGWLAGNSQGRQPGGTDQKLAGGARAVGIVANMGHGGGYFKTDEAGAPVYAIGDNVNGELGLGNRTSTAGAALKLPLTATLTHAAGGFGHTVARLADGTVWTWGDNFFGQLGVGLGRTELRRALTPRQVTLPHGALAVAATTVASYALLEDGTVWAWGDGGGFGLLGDGRRTGGSTSPAQVPGLADVVQLAARDHDVVVVKADGSVWQWGSFPADPVAFVPGDPSLPYAGGHLVPTQVTGLPAGVGVRKLLTEQGVFAALLENGHVYAWGVHFDITADQILRDLVAARVLGLPPLRDLMPGGFIGYGGRPFDRLTALGVDYQGGFWKVRGRVAEVFDPTLPALQRRPTNQGPRVDCLACHTFLDQSLVELLASAPPTSGAACQSPPSVHAGPNGSLIHAETICVQCHNPARLVYPVHTPSGLVPFEASGGWPNCPTPDGLPARTFEAPPIVSTPCAIPPRHPFTPPGTICSTCHASVKARPLVELAPVCAQPEAGALPSLATITTVGGARDAGGLEIPAGGLTATGTPLVHGTLSEALAPGESLAIARNGIAAGDAIVTGNTWTFPDAPPDGAVEYRARVVLDPEFGAWSNAFTFEIDATAPAVLAAVTGFVDEALGPVAPGGFASDATPGVAGTLDGALAAGEAVQVLRGGSLAGTAAVAGASFTFVEPAALAPGNYGYQARVIDAAGNLGPTSAAATVTLVGALPVPAIAQVTGGGVPIPGGGATTSTAPQLSGTLDAPLQAGFVLRVYRGGTLAGPATVGGTSWTFGDASVPDGTWSYTARVEAGAVLGQASAPYVVTVDTVAPAQAANVTLVSDDFNGPLADGATSADLTPAVSGTLSAPLAAGEQVRLLRNGSTAATVSASGTTWTFTEPAALASATYTYQARVLDAAGQLGPLGATRSVTLDASAVPLIGAATTLSTVNGVAPTANAVPPNNVRTPVLAGTLERALGAGEVVRVYRDGTAAGTATVTGTSWTFTSASLADGSYAFRARVELSGNPAVFGASSATVTDPVDGTAPAQAATVVAVYDDTSTLVDVTDTFSTDLTPRVDGTLSAALGAGDFVRVVRDGAEVARLRPAGTTWTYTDTALALGAHTYGAEVRDDAGNLGTAPASPTHAVTLVSASSLPSATITSAAVSGTGSPGKPNGTVVASGGVIPDATPTLTIALGAALPAGYQVAVSRDGAQVGTLATCASPCTFTDPGATEGDHVYTARTRAGPVLGAQSVPYVLTVDVTAPAQVVTIAQVRSDQAPTSTVAGAVPPSATVTNGGNTNDATPIFRYTLSAALGAGESVSVRRGATPVAVTTSSCGAGCFEFPAPTGLTVWTDMADPSGLPAGTTAVFQGVPGSPVSFTIRVVDAAGLEGAATPAWTLNVGYFRCDQARADATYGAAFPGFTHGAISVAANPTSRCTSCHAPAANGHPATGGTPAGFFVASPATGPSYWCRRP